MDDNKISHEDPAVVTEVINLMKSHFGDLTLTRDNKHRLLGMNIIITDKNIVEIEMRDQLKEVIDMFTLSEGQEINEMVTSPAQKHLREVNPNGV